MLYVQENLHLRERLVKSEQDREEVQAYIQGLEALIAAQDKVVIAKEHVVEGVCQVGCTCFVPGCCPAWRGMQELQRITVSTIRSP